MNSSKSLPKPGNRVSFKPVPPFEMFYQLTYMSAMASAGITRAKTFELAAQSSVSAAQYFAAVNTLVDEFRYDYAEACRRVGIQSKSDNMRSFLLRLSDALRSGEPLADFLVREAEVMGRDYENQYERNLESLKQWSNAFSSIVISVALIIIIQVISSMIYSSNLAMIGGLVVTGIIMASFAAWIIWRSAPQEVMTVKPTQGSIEQRRSFRLFQRLMPVALMVTASLYMFGVAPGIVLIVFAAMILPIGITSMRSDRKVTKKDVEFSTFLRSTGGMASSAGTTLNESLTRIDLSSFPTLEPDITRLMKRLQARVSPEQCWRKFGMDSGSRLISDVIDIFYGAIKIGGSPDRVGYLCSLFAAKTSQLRARRRLVTGTFSGLTTVMQAIVAGLMIFVLSIVQSFAALVATLMPVAEEAAMANQPQMSMGMAEFAPEELQFLAAVTLIMVIMLAIISAAAIILSDGGYRLKVALYLSFTIFISGVCMIIVPPMVSGILTI